MESRQLMKSNVHRDVLRKRSTHYLEKLQKVMDSARTASQNLELRKKFIQRQNNMNYRNEYDRLHGELLGLGSPDKIKEAINMMMDKDKLKAIGEYKEPDSIGPVGPTVATPVAPKKPFKINLLGPRAKSVPAPRGRPRNPIDIRDDITSPAPKRRPGRPPRGRSPT
jgi:hypothetical protein